MGGLVSIFLLCCTKEFESESKVTGGTETYCKVKAHSEGRAGCSEGEAAPGASRGIPFMGAAHPSS